MSNCSIKVALLSFKTQTLVALATAPPSALISCILIQCAMLTNRSSTSCNMFDKHHLERSECTSCWSCRTFAGHCKQAADTVLGVWHSLSRMESTTGPSQLASLSPWPNPSSLSHNWTRNRKKLMKFQRINNRLLLFKRWLRPNWKYTRDRIKTKPRLQSLGWSDVVSFRRTTPY